jgi:asparagine synthetase B (glutamine-hydrolysing)
MIAAAFARDGATIDRWCEALERAVGSGPSSAWSVAGVRLLAYAGPAAGALRAEDRLAWIGTLDGFDPRRPWASRGDFAFAASIDDGDALLLARGRFGGRPLYYALGPSTGSALACSRLEPLVAALGHPPLDVDALAATLVHADTADHATALYRGVRRVPGACVLRLGARGIEARHDLPCDIAPARSGAPDDLARELDVQIGRAVARAMPARSTAAVLVSGGIDSSALLAKALEERGGRDASRVHAVNLDFGARGDDRACFGLLCDRLRVTPARIRPADCAPIFRETLCLDAAPAHWPTVPFEVAMARAGRARGADRTLSGVGGDDLFDGDMNLFAARARRGRLFSAAWGALALQGWGASTPATRARALLLRPLVEPCLPKAARSALQRRRERNRARWAGPRLRALLAARGIVDREETARAPAPYERSSLCDLARSPVLTWWKEARGQLEVAAGSLRVEPYLDDGIFEFLASLRPDVLFHGQDGPWVRGLFRHAVGDQIPTEIAWRVDKSDFEPAFVELAKALGGIEALRPRANGQALADLGLVDPAALGRRFDELVSRPLDGSLWVELWPVIAADALVQKHAGVTS